MLRLVDRAILERCLGAEMSLEAIGRLVGRHPSTVAYWVAKYGLNAAHRDRHRSRGGIEEAQLRTLAAAGLSIRSMADRLGVSYTTVRYWLRQTGLETGWSNRQRRIEQARVAGTQRLELVCPRHGACEFVREGRGYFRRARCRAERVTERRRAIKEQLVTEAGGRCVICGYDRTPSALHFHHRDPPSKEFAIGGRGVTRALALAQAEAAKCVLLCATCHAEVEAGAVRLL